MNIIKNLRNIKQMIFLSFILYLICVIESKNTFFLNALLNYGLHGVLTPLFYFSFFIFIISVLVWFDNYKLGFLDGLIITILFSVFLYGTPIIVEPNMRFTTAYKSLAWVDYIIDHNFLNRFVYDYHSWPIFSTFNAILFILLGDVDYTFFIKTYPLFINYVYVIALLPIMKIFHKSKYWFGIWLFLINNWINQDYFSPQSLAFIFILFIFYLIYDNEEYNSKEIFLIFFFTFILIYTHLLSSIYVLLFVVFVYVLKKQFLNKRVLSYILVIFMIAFIWFFYYYANKDFVVRLLDKLFMFDLIYEKNITGKFSTNIIRNNLNYIKFGTVFVTLFVSIYEKICLYKIKQYKILKFDLVIIFILGIIGVSTFYGGEIFLRIYLFYFYIISIQSLPLLNTNRTKKIIYMVVVLISLLHIVNHYGSDYVEYTKQTETNMSDYISSFGSNPKLIISNYAYIHNCYSTLKKDGVLIKPFYQTNKDFSCDQEYICIISEKDFRINNYYRFDNTMILKHADVISYLNYYNVLFTNSDTYIH